jgi:cytochrome c oxidase cbb3-type subunit 1
VRFIGGAIFFTGMLLMAFNVWKTIGDSQPQPQKIEGAVHV